MLLQFLMGTVCREKGMGESEKGSIHEETEVLVGGISGSYQENKGRQAKVWRPGIVGNLFILLFLLSVS